MLVRDEEGRKKKAKQHSTPKAFTFPKKKKLPQVGLKPTTLNTPDRVLCTCMYMYTYIHVYTVYENISVNSQEVKLPEWQLCTGTIIIHILNFLVHR